MGEWRSQSWNSIIKYKQVFVSVQLPNRIRSAWSDLNLLSLYDKCVYVRERTHFLIACCAVCIKWLTLNHSHCYHYCDFILSLSFWNTLACSNRLLWRVSAPSFLLYFFICIFVVFSHSTAAIVGDILPLPITKHIHLHHIFYMLFTIFITWKRTCVYKWELHALCVCTTVCHKKVYT